MDPKTVQEARRLLTELVLYGKVTLFGGRKVQPDDNMLLTLLEKVAAKKIEEIEVPVEVLDFEPRSTYHAKTKSEGSEA